MNPTEVERYLRKHIDRIVKRGGESVPGTISALRLAADEIRLLVAAGVSTREPWLDMDSHDVAGRIGLARNEFGGRVTVFVCGSCSAVFTVGGEHTTESWGDGCLDITCDSYNVERDVDLMFEIEPWRIHRAAWTTGEGTP